MSTLHVIGRVMNDLELKSSAKQKPYTRFTLCERVGFGEYAHLQHIQVWAWNDLATELVQSGIQKGRMIQADGFLELEEYVTKGGKSRDKRLKLKLTDWAPAPHGKGERKGPCRPAFQESKPDTADIIDGERDELPE